jgi:hypothetical protein
MCRPMPTRGKVSSSSPMLSTAAATPPSTASPPPPLVLLPPCDPPPSPSRPLRPLDRPWPCLGPSCGVDALPVRRVECRYRPHPPRREAGPLRQRRRRGCRKASVSLRRSAVDPPSSRATATAAWRRQHGNVGGRPWQPGAATTTP